MSLSFTRLIIASVLVFMIHVFSGSNLTFAHTCNGIRVENKSMVAPEAHSYQWSFNGKELAGENTKEIFPNESGLYQVALTSELGDSQIKEATVLVSQNSLIIIYVISDSTVANYNGSQYPQTGWGQILNHYFDDSKVEIRNRARGGRSSKSFYVEGLWAGVKAELQTGNYVFIQWGHNDRDWSKPERYADTATYKSYLRLYINESRALGAIPVLISPMTLNTGERNVFTEGANDYRAAMLDVSEKLDVPFIDLNTRSYDRIRELGSSYAANFLFLGLRSGEYKNYPNGINDFTHFQEMGSLEMARLISEEMSKQADRTDIADIVSALKPLYELNVKTNHPETGLFTQSTKLPEGVNVTLKMYNDENQDFFGWLDHEKRFFSPDLRTSFTMEARDLTFEAMFDFDTVAMPQDCYGSYGGDAETDICGKCANGFTGIEACYFDCNKVLGGKAYLDSCDNCVGGNTGEIPCDSIVPLGTSFEIGHLINFGPNPFQKSMDISMNSSFTYSIKDLSGKLLIEQYCNTGCTIGESLKKGVYILTVAQQGQLIQHKIIKEK